MLLVTLTFFEPFGWVGGFADTRILAWKNDSRHHRHKILSVGISRQGERVSVGLSVARARGVGVSAGAVDK